jgi:hypothetical protein
MGAPDSPVRQPLYLTVRVRTQMTIGALSSSGTGQYGAAPDRNYSLSGAPLTCVLTSTTYCSVVRALCSRPLRLRVVASLGAPDSPVNYSEVALEKPDGG